MFSKLRGMAATEAQQRQFLQRQDLRTAQASGEEQAALPHNASAARIETGETLRPTLDPSLAALSAGAGHIGEAIVAAPQPMSL